jgi:hypothetical protein
VTRPFRVGGVVHCPAAAWAACPLRAQWTTRAQGRRVAIPPDARLLRARQERQQTPEGRAKLRERVAVAHALAHVGRWQGRRARYCGLRKTVLALRRSAVVHNLHVIARRSTAAKTAPHDDWTGVLGIVKAGNRPIRAMAIEMAWGGWRFPPESALSRGSQARFGQGRPRVRKIGLVARARKLLIALWRFLETGGLPLGALLKAEVRIR